VPVSDIGRGWFSPGGHCPADRHSACVRAEKHVDDRVIRPDAAVDEFVGIWRLLRVTQRKPSLIQATCFGPIVPSEDRAPTAWSLAGNSLGLN
jgi:hypothetical protein